MSFTVSDIAITSITVDNLAPSMDTIEVFGEIRRSGIPYDFGSKKLHAPDFKWKHQSGFAKMKSLTEEGSFVGVKVRQKGKMLACLCGDPEICHVNFNLGKEVKKFKLSEMRSNVEHTMTKTDMRAEVTLGVK